VRLLRPASSAHRHQENMINRVSNILSRGLATRSLRPGFRLGVYVFKDAEVIDFAAPYGVFSVARRKDPSLDVFFIADSSKPVQTQAGFTVLPNYSFLDRPAMDAFLIPGGFGTRQETYNTVLHDYIRSLPASTLLTSVCTGRCVDARVRSLTAHAEQQPDLCVFPMRIMVALPPQLDIRTDGLARWSPSH
jgi:putative intracellular protease/amidase